MKAEDTQIPIDTSFARFGQVWRVLKDKLSRYIEAEISGMCIGQNEAVMSIEKR